MSRETVTWKVGIGTLNLDNVKKLPEASLRQRRIRKPGEKLVVEFTGFSFERLASMEDTFMKTPHTASMHIFEDGKKSIGVIFFPPNSSYTSAFALVKRLL